MAQGDKQAVYAHTRRARRLVVSGATAHSAHTPEKPQVSRLQIDMGVRVPLFDDWPADQSVDGRHPGFGHVIELPVRDASVRLVSSQHCRRAMQAPRATTSS